MTFRSIGTLAGDVLRKSARTAERRARAFDGKPPSASGSLPMPAGMADNEGGPTQRGGVAVGPTLCTDAPAPSDTNGLPVYIAPRTGKRVERPTSREVTDRPDCELNEDDGALRRGPVAGEPSPNKRPVLRVIDGRGRRSAKPSNGGPRPALRLPVLSVIEGGHCAGSLSRAGALDFLDLAR
jgi:hypothetical protein